MACCRALTVAGSWSVRTGCALLLGAALLAPALRADRVYVWRDQNGVVRFSTVEQPAAAPAEAPHAAPAAAERDGNGESPVAARAN